MWPAASSYSSVNKKPVHRWHMNSQLRQHLLKAYVLVGLTRKTWMSTLPTPNYIVSTNHLWLESPRPSLNFKPSASSFTNSLSTDVGHHNAPLAHSQILYWRAKGLGKAKAYSLKTTLDTSIQGKPMNLCKTGSWNSCMCTWQQSSNCWQYYRNINRRTLWDFSKL